MPIAKVGDTILAQSDKTETVEGNYYFPKSAIQEQYFKPAASGLTTVCGWKGTASYYDIELPDGQTLKDAAWYYPKAKDAAKNIEGYVAFYKSKVNVSA